LVSRLARAVLRNTASVVVFVASALMVGCTAVTDSPAATGSAIATGNNSPDAVHERILVLDAHADIELADKPSRYAGPDGVSRVAPQKLRAGGVDAVVMAIAVGPGARDAAGHAAALAQANAELEAVEALVQEPANNVVLATTAAEVVQASDDDKAALILGFQNARSLAGDVDAIDEFYARGVRVFALTHMGHNNFADSSRPVYRAATSSYEVDEEHGGLSALGVAAIQRINALGGLVDVSQLSKNATLQVLNITTAPVIASHSNVKALSNVRRNLSDEELDAIKTNGGVVHIAAFRGYLFNSNDKVLDANIKAARRSAGLPEKYDYPYELYWELDGMDKQLAYTNAISKLLGPGSVEAMIDHIDYVVARIGIDHVGIGNDFNHGGGVAGYSDASGAKTLTRALLARGYSEADIGKIWSGNFLRVFAQAQATGG